ncbi:MAG: type II secretion system major pseudopilin GspG [Rudaea sp.]|nr:type II secretion system major pseudopilin GspG [Rudaea sp.]
MRTVQVVGSRFWIDGARRRDARCCRRPAIGNRRTSSKGFTLIEILVVVVILGILAAIVVPRVMEHPGEARQVRAKQDIQAIVTALNTYKLDNYTYPSTEQGLDALVHKPSGAPEAPNWHGYLDKTPKDPWGKPYLYLHPGSHGDVDVFSYGADGKPGGEGEDADVGNWD